MSTVMDIWSDKVCSLHAAQRRYEIWLNRKSIFKYQIHTGIKHFKRHKAMRNQTPSNGENSGMQEHDTIQPQNGYSTM